MTEGIKEALFLLIRIFGAYFIIVVTRNVSADSKCPKYKAYLYALAASAFFAWMSWNSYGTHVEDADPLKGGGVEVVDFETTQEMRNRHGLFMFTILSALSLTGTFTGLRIRDKTNVETRKRRRQTEKINQDI